MADYTEVLVKFDDLTGEGATMKLTAPGLADATAFAGLVTALDGVSSAAINGISFTATDAVPVGTAEDDDYSSPQDKAEFVFSSIGGEYVISVPAPDPAIFGPDKETVLSAVPPASTFIAAIVANGTDPNGNALSFVRARRTRTNADY